MKKNQNQNQNLIKMSMIVAAVAFIVSVTAITMSVSANNELTAIKKEQVVQNLKHTELTARFYNLQKCYLKQEVECANGKYFNNKMWQDQIDTLLKSE